MAFNKISGLHSLGKDLIRLSKFGRDSVSGKDGLQYLYHPIAYGPYLADKYGYPNVSKLHQFDPQETKKVGSNEDEGYIDMILYAIHTLQQIHVYTRIYTHHTYTLTFTNLRMYACLK